MSLLSRLWRQASEAVAAVAAPAAVHKDLQLRALRQSRFAR
jgi:hypothetical protein